MSELIISLNKIAIEVSKYINEIKDEKDLSKIIGIHSGDTTRLIDKRSEEYIFELLRNTGLKIRFVSEESGVINKENYDYTAVIDPLDGSTNFLLDIPWYSVSVALYDKNANGILDSVAGFVVHVPYNKVYSYDEKYAYIDGEIFRVYDNSTLPKVILTYFDDRGLDKALKILDSVKGYKIRSLGSASLDMILVCTGKAYMYFDIRGKLRNVDISASSNFCKHLNLIPTTLTGSKINSGIDDIYKIDEIILSRDQDLMKRIFSFFS